MNATVDSAAPMSVPAPKTRRRRWLRYLLYAALALLLSALLADQIWKASGSNEWQLSMESEGVQVWTLKTPGNPLIRVRAKSTIDSSLGGMLKLLEDLDSCADAGCYDARVIEQVPALDRQYLAFSTFKFDIPGFKPREYVLLQRHLQDPVSKAVDLDIIAAPNKLPRDPCCVRITHLFNSWRLTPLPGNKLEVEFMQDTDIGGLPYWMANAFLKYGTFEIMKGMPALMDMERYRNARLDYVEELVSTQTTGENAHASAEH